MAQQAQPTESVAQQAESYLPSAPPALHWAMTDQPPPSSQRIALRSPTACAELRQCIQHCYALSLSRRYNKTKDAASQHLANK